jgi:hypothetical protein
MRLLDLAPARITVPIFAAIWRAVIGESNFTIHLTGDTTTGKTSLAALAQQHFGAAMHRDNLPASWLSTGNALEVRAFEAKDTLLVVDDFVLGGTYRDRQRKLEDFDRLVRAQANRANRSRLRSDGTIATDRPPRALILSTGEDLPDRLSTLNRLLSLTLGKQDINWSRMTEAQADAEAGFYAGAMAAYICWCASWYDELQRQVVQERKEQRQRCAQVGFRGRTVDVISELRIGLLIWARFAVEKGGISAESADRHLRAAEMAFEELLRAQTRDQAEIAPARRFIDLLRSALVGGDAYLVTREGGVPPQAERCGWRNHDSPGRHKIGWVDGDNVYLDPAQSYRAALELARAIDQPLPLTPRTLGRTLYESGCLVDAELNRRTYCVRRTCEGSETLVLFLPASSLFSASGEVFSADGADGCEEGLQNCRQQGSQSVSSRRQGLGLADGANP